MEVKVKNKDLTAILDSLNRLQIAKITIGTKSRIQKIVKALADDAKNYKELIVAIFVKLGVAPNADGNYISPPNFDKNEEFMEISELENTVNIDQFDYKMIENVESDGFINFDLISLFCENYK